MRLCDSHSPQRQRYRCWDERGGEDEALPVLLSVVASYASPFWWKWSWTVDRQAYVLSPSLSRNQLNFRYAELVELMNGEVKVESTLDVGTTFSCFVAGTIVDADGEVPFPLEITAESDGVPLVVLVCEDNPMSQRLLKRQLERAGHHVDTANGEPFQCSLSCRPLF